MVYKLVLMKKNVKNIEFSSLISNVKGYNKIQMGSDITKKQM